MSVTVEISTTQECGIEWYADHIRSEMLRQDRNLLRTVPRGVSLTGGARKWIVELADASQRIAGQDCAWVRREAAGRHNRIAWLVMAGHVEVAGVPGSVFVRLIEL